MNNDTTPGLGNQSTVRTVARVLAVVLLAAGLVMALMGISAFLGSMSDPMDPLAPNGFESILLIGAGGFCIVFGLAAAQVGWLRAGSSYVAGETMPVVKDSLAYVTATGPFCRQCGTRNDDDATFCDSCGQSLA